ncbi:TPA: four helix bundle protein [Patescibacteria group bacterium]|nr:four helix bundle protein [Patescibacteria group bacterium]
MSFPRRRESIQIKMNIKIQNNKAGYEYLLAYKITVPIYDYTVEFCKRWIDYKSRTKDQMEQAARSGMVNIAEGHQQKSLASYIKLVGVAAGSQEELLKDYQAFARQQRLPIWEKDRIVREVRELGEVWDIIKKSPTLPNSPDFPSLPKNPEVAVNLMITQVNQACYLLHRLETALEQKHTREGGYTEQLLKKRLEYKSRYG